MPSIDFRQLPLTAGGLSNLFNDYLYDFPKVKQFYPSDFHLLENVRPQIEKAHKSADHRSMLADILKEQNISFGCGEKTLENIRLLRDEKTFCVVTGQQVGILGGPLYTLYKTSTIIKLAQRLGKLYPEYNFVPVFWLEGEDHDFAEANHITLLSHENLPIKIEYLPDIRPLEKNIGAVGEIVLDNSFQSFLSRVEKTLPSSEFRTQLLTLVSESYRTGRTFNQSFAHWIGKLCVDDTADGPSETGVVFLSSHDKRIKKMLAPIFLRELEEFPHTSQLVIDQSAQLEKDYHAQIKPKAMNLFLFHKGGRYLIEPRENDFSLKGVRYYLTRDELMRIATETPEMLSPNVVLRTICQDTLLPSVAYVAGPSEIAYFAQLKPVYKYFSVEMPMIYPRASATIVEQKLQHVLEKYQLELIDFFSNRERLNARVIDLLSEVNLDELFTNSGKQMEEVLGEMKFGLNYIDPTLLGALETTRAKMESQLHVLKEKAAAAQRRRHEIALKQIDKVMNSVSPNGSFQERELNILHFMNKYGLEFPRWLFSRLQIDVFAHQVIEL